MIKITELLRNSHLKVAYLKYSIVNLAACSRNKFCSYLGSIAIIYICVSIQLYRNYHQKILKCRRLYFNIQTSVYLSTITDVCISTGVSRHQFLYFLLFCISLYQFSFQVISLLLTGNLERSFKTESCGCATNFLNSNTHNIESFGCLIKH